MRQSALFGKSVRDVTGDARTAGHRHLYQGGFMRARGETLDAKLAVAGIEVLLDDRDASAGVKLTDADLIGLPHRIVVSKQGAKDGTVEHRLRRTEEGERMSELEVLKRIVDS